jgi:hypothetical protein
MKAIICAIGAMLAVTAANAGPEQLIKQRAKDIRDQNNARQGVPPPSTAPAQPQTQKPAAAAPARPSPAQQSLARFQGSLGEIKSGAVLDETTKQKLARELSGAAQYKKPSAANVDRLVIALFNAMSAKPLSATARTRLAQNIDAVLNPAKYPQAKMPAIYDDVQSIFKSAGVPVMLVSEVNTALRALGAEVQS